MLGVDFEMDKERVQLSAPYKFDYYTRDRDDDLKAGNTPEFSSLTSQNGMHQACQTARMIV